MSQNFGMESNTHKAYRKNPGYFERLGTSCGGIVTGFILVVIAFPVLFLNEVFFAFSIFYLRQLARENNFCMDIFLQVACMYI